MVLMTGVTRLMFCAHDNGEHTLCYSSIAGKWMLENPRVGIVRQYHSLVSGLSELERVSGNNSTEFTVTDNPYGD
jgi:hypothetical protein